MKGASRESEDRRAELCRSLGFGNEREIYKLIAACAKTGPEALLRHGLKAVKLGGFAQLPVRRELGCRSGKRVL